MRGLQSADVPHGFDGEFEGICIAICKQQLMRRNLSRRSAHESAFA